MKLRNYILLTISTLTLAGCTSEDINNTPNEERIPLRLEATLSGDCPVTRAYDNVFEENDKLLSYVQHVYTDGDEIKEAAGIQASLVTFTKGKEAMEADEDSKNKTSDLTPVDALYWDDFSKSSDDGANDLRTAGHGLRSYYGYCFNGTDVANSDFDDTKGEVKWTTTTDQSIAGEMKKNDLLWSKTQSLVKYDHAPKVRGTLTIPYTHAMSKFIIVLVAGEGFTSTDLSYATVTLSGMNSKGTFTAPTATVVPEATTTTVKMYGNTASTTTDNKPCRAYEAVVVPITALTKNNLLATIEGMSGNTYKVYITDDILTKWSENAALNEGKTQSGINYKLTVTLNKQAVGVVANIANWSDVSATGNGEIQFNTDITTIDKSNATTLKSGDAFSLWMAKKGESVLTDTDLGSIATTSTYNGKSFENSPSIYWPNGSDNFYFRALAKKSADENKTMDAVTEKTVAQGTDLLWGTTAAHKGNTTIDYAEGAAINPRTGEVPLVFKHAMSNVIVKLKTTDNAADPDYVTLSGAKVKLVKLVTSGSIDIANGKVSASSTPADQAFEKTVDTDFKVSELMVPQTLTSDAKLVITVADGTTNGTTYSLKLSDCTLENSTTAISEWESGKQYTYTITLRKEAVKFLVLVKDWTPTTGSGNATLDWD
jgi:hypothetical protein